MNLTSPFAYQFLLYQEKSPGVIVPQYQLLESQEAGVGNFATETRFNEILIESNKVDQELQRSDSPFLARLALDARFHYSMLSGMRGDARFQKCVEAPLGDEFSTDLNGDVDDLTQALASYRQGIVFYLDYLKTSAGYENFQSLVPEIPYHQFYYATSSNEYEQIPGPVAVDWDQTRYRDLAMLIELLNDYGRSSEALIDILIRRNNPAADPVPSDRELALAIATQGQRNLQAWSDFFLGAFPDQSVFSEERTPGLSRSLLALRNTITELGNFQSSIAGQTNPLGFADDFLMLIPTTAIQGAANNYETSFHSFDLFMEQINAATTGVLPVAVAALEAARTANSSFEDDRDSIASEGSDLIEEYRERLKEIAGAFPDENEFDSPGNNRGSAIWEQLENIRQSRAEVTRNGIRISSLREEIQIEIRRNETEKGINLERDDLKVSYGDKISKIDDQIAAIEISQNALQGFTDILDPELLASGPAGLIALGAKAVNVAAQAGAEVGKLELESQKEELATQQMKAETALDNDLLDANSKALISTRLLEMKELNLDSQLTAANLRQELGRLAALYNELDELLAGIELAENSIATRFYADPAARLSVQGEYQRALFKFREARQWLFFATRALEYKWNRAYPELESLFQIRNADELGDYFVDLQNFDDALANSITVAGMPTDWFSIRDHVFNIPVDQVGREEAFRLRLAEFIDPATGVITIDFSTAREIANSNFFNGPVFDVNGNIVANQTGTFLDKINSMRILFTFEESSDTLGSGQSVGNLSYGGLSYLRNESPGTFVPDRPDRLKDEMTSFSTKTWAFQSEGGLGFTTSRWVQDQKPVPHQVTVAEGVEGSRAQHDTAVAPSQFQILNFQERAVAATNWQLNMPTRDGNTPRFNLDGITDIKIRFEHFTATRSAQ